VSFTLAMWLLYKLARLDTGPVTARIAVLSLATFPVGFFLMAPYTESLYLLVTLASFWFVRSGRPWLAGTFGFGAAICRTVGIFMALPLAFEYLYRCWKAKRRPGIDGLSALLPVAGTALFALYQRVVLHDYRSATQIGGWFGDKYLMPWHPIPDSWNYITHSGDPVEILNLASLIGFIVLAVWATRRLAPVYGCYVWPYLALMCCRESFYPLGSTARYLLVLFPCFIALSSLLARRRWLATGWLVASLMLQVVFLQYWMLNNFVA
jgi:hypothetical protein